MFFSLKSIGKTLIIQMLITYSMCTTERQIELFEHKNAKGNSTAAV